MRILLALAVSFLAGCHSYYQERIYGNENSPYFSVPIDSTVVLRRDLEVSSRSDRIFFQDGTIVPLREVNRYLPYCFLKLDIWKETPQRVAPDTFTVRRVYDEMRYQLAVHGIRLAQLDRSGTDYQVVAKVHELASERQPDVRDLVCAAWGLPQDMSRVTIKLMREQLGDYFDLQLALAPADSGPSSRGAGSGRRGY